MSSVYEDSICYTPFKKYDSILNDKSENFETKVTSLIEVWSSISELNLSQFDIRYVIQIIDWAKLHALNIVLTGEWRTTKEIFRNNLLESIEKAQSSLVTVNDAFSSRCQKLADVVKKPWEDPVLANLIQEKDVEIGSKEIEFFCVETAYLVSVRLKKLCENHCEDLALNLVTNFLKYKKLATVKNFNLNATETQLWFIFDIYVALLYKFHDRAKILQQFEELQLGEGVLLIKRFAKKRVKISKIWRNCHKIAIFGSRFFMSRALMKYTDEYSDYLTELLKTYLGLSNTDTLLQEFVISVRNITNLADAAGLCVMCEVIHREAGGKIRVFAIEMYIRALTTDMNELERLKHVNEEDKVKSTTSRLSKTFTNLADLLDEHVKVARECVLTAFSLEPTKDRLGRIVDLAKRSGFPVLDTGQEWKCRLHPPVLPSDDLAWVCPECGEWMSKPELSAPLQMNMALHEALQESVLGISEALCDDLVVCLSNPRYQILSWLLDWSDLYRLCILYLNDPEKTKNFVTELKFVDVDYSMFEHIKREPVDEYTGIEKGYEQYLDLDFVSDEEETSSVSEDSMSHDRSVGLGSDGAGEPYLPLPQPKSDPVTLKSLRMFRPNLKRKKEDSDSPNVDKKTAMQVDALPSDTSSLGSYLSSSQYNPYSDYSTNIPANTKKYTPNILSKTPSSSGYLSQAAGVTKPTTSNLSQVSATSNFSAFGYSTHAANSFEVPKQPVIHSRSKFDQVNSRIQPSFNSSVSPVCYPAKVSETRKPINVSLSASKILHPEKSVFNTTNLSSASSTSYVSNIIKSTLSYGVPKVTMTIPNETITSSQSCGLFSAPQQVSILNTSSHSQSNSTFSVHSVPSQKDTFQQATNSADLDALLNEIDTNKFETDSKNGVAATLLQLGGQVAKNQKQSIQVSQQSSLSQIPTKLPQETSLPNGTKKECKMRPKNNTKLDKVNFLGAILDQTIEPPCKQQKLAHESNNPDKINLPGKTSFRVMDLQVKITKMNLQKYSKEEISNLTGIISDKPGIAPQIQKRLPIIQGSNVIKQFQVPIIPPMSPQEHITQSKAQCPSEMLQPEHITLLQDRSSSRTEVPIIQTHHQTKTAAEQESPILPCPKEQSFMPQQQIRQEATMRLATQSRQVPEPQLKIVLNRDHCQVPRQRRLESVIIVPPVKARTIISQAFLQQCQDNKPLLKEPLSEIHSASISLVKNQEFPEATNTSRSLPKAGVNRPFKISSQFTDNKPASQKKYPATCTLVDFLKTTIPITMDCDKDKKVQINNQKTDIEMTDVKDLSFSTAEDNNKRCVSEVSLKKTDEQVSSIKDEIFKFNKETLKATKISLKQISEELKVINTQNINDSIIIIDSDSASDKVRLEEKLKDNNENTQYNSNKNDENFSTSTEGVRNRVRQWILENNRPRNCGKIVDNKKNVCDKVEANIVQNKIETKRPDSTKSKPIKKTAKRNSELMKAQSARDKQNYLKIENKGFNVSSDQQQDIATYSTQNHKSPRMHNAADNLSGHRLFMEDRNGIVPTAEVKKAEIRGNEPEIQIAENIVRTEDKNDIASTAEVKEAAVRADESEIKMAENIVRAEDINGVAPSAEVKETANLANESEIQITENIVLAGDINGIASTAEGKEAGVRANKPKIQIAENIVMAEDRNDVASTVGGKDAALRANEPKIQIAENIVRTEDRNNVAYTFEEKECAVRANEPEIQIAANIVKTEDRNDVASTVGEKEEATLRANIPKIQITENIVRTEDKNGIESTAEVKEAAVRVNKPEIQIAKNIGSAENIQKSFKTVKVETVPAGNKPNKNIVQSTRNHENANQRSISTTRVSRNIDSTNKLAIAVCAKESEIQINENVSREEDIQESDKIVEVDAVPTVNEIKENILLSICNQEIIRSKTIGKKKTHNSSSDEEKIKIGTREPFQYVKFLHNYCGGPSLPSKTSESVAKHDSSPMKYEQNVENKKSEESRSLSSLQPHSHKIEVVLKPDMPEVQDDYVLFTDNLCETYSDLKKENISSRISIAKIRSTEERTKENGSASNIARAVHDNFDFSRFESRIKNKERNKNIKKYSNTHKRKHENVPCFKVDQEKDSSKKSHTSNKDNFKAKELSVVLKRLPHSVTKRVQRTSATDSIAVLQQRLRETIRDNVGASMCVLYNKQEKPVSPLLDLNVRNQVRKRRHRKQKPEYVKNTVKKGGVVKKKPNLPICGILKKKSHSSKRPRREKKHVRFDSAVPKIFFYIKEEDDDDDEEDDPKSMLKNVPGLNDFSEVRPRNLEHVVNVVQVPGSRTSTVTSQNSQTSTQVSAHIQRVGQPKPEQKSSRLEEQPEQSASSSATTSRGSTKPTPQTKPGQKSNHINILSNQILKQSGKPASHHRKKVEQPAPPTENKQTATVKVEPEENAEVQAGRSINTNVKIVTSTTQACGAAATATSSTQGGTILQFICKSSSLPKFQQAFGKTVYQTNSSNEGVTETVGAPTSESLNQTAMVVDTKKIATKAVPVNVQPITGNVIFRGQVPVGQTVSLIPPGSNTRQLFRITGSTHEQISLVKETVIQNKMSALLAAALQGKPKITEQNGELVEEYSATRITLCRPGTVPPNATRIVKPVQLQIPANVIRAPQPNLSSTTLEQLREFDMVYKQVKERSSNPAQLETTPQNNQESPQQQRISFTYVNQVQKYTQLSPVVVVSSYSPLQQTVSPTLTVTSQAGAGACLTQVSTVAVPKVAVKTSKGKNIKSSATKTSPTTVPTIPKPQQKPQEDEHTTQRIFDILAEYAEQLRNSPDLNNKPAPRRRSNPPTNPSSSTSGSSSSKKKKKKSNSSTTSNLVETDNEDLTMGSEDSSGGNIVQLSMTDEEQSQSASITPPETNLEPATSNTPTPRPLIVTDTSNQPRNVIITDSSVGEALKMPNTALIMPGSYIMPVSVVKGGQQIAVVSGGSKILTTVPARSGQNMLLFQSFVNQNKKGGISTVKYSTIQPFSGISSQNVSGVTSQPPVVLPSSSVATVALGQPITLKKLEDNERGTNTELLLTISQPREAIKVEQSPDFSQPDSSTGLSSDAIEVKIEEGSQSDSSSNDVFNNIQKTNSVATSVIASVVKKEQEERCENSTTVNTSVVKVEEPCKQVERIGSVLVNASTSNGPMLSHTNPRYRKTPENVESTTAPTKEFNHNVTKVPPPGTKIFKNNAVYYAIRTKKAVGKKLDSEMQKQAAMEREIRLQKSLSEECEDLGVDEPSTSDLFPEADLLFDSNHSPSYDHTGQRIQIAEVKAKASMNLFSDDENSGPMRSDLFDYVEYHPAETGVDQINGNNASNESASSSDDTTLLPNCGTMSEVTLNSPISPEYTDNTHPVNKYKYKYTNRKKGEKAIRSQTDNWSEMTEVTSTEDSIIEVTKDDDTPIAIQEETVIDDSVTDVGLTVDDKLSQEKEFKCPVHGSTDTRGYKKNNIKKTCSCFNGSRSPTPSNVKRRVSSPKCQTPTHSKKPLLIKKR